MDLLTFDGEAPRLGAPATQWREDELRILLAGMEGILTDGPRMGYLLAFLGDLSSAKSYCDTPWLQQRLVDLLRLALLGTDPPHWDTHSEEDREQARRLVAVVQSQNRHLVDADLPRTVWQDLLRIDLPCLLVPKGLDPPEVASGLKAEGSTLLLWLKVLDRAVAKIADDGAMEPLLKAATCCPSR